MKNKIYKINKLLSHFSIQISKIYENDYKYYKYLDAMIEPKYVNLGGGDFYHRFWVNVDFDNDYYKEKIVRKNFINFDLTSFIKLPFKDNSVNIFYSSHLIEHLSNEHNDFLFSEVYRCLNNGGIFRIVCPDNDLYYNAYIRNDIDFFKYKSAFGFLSETIQQRFLDHFASCLTLQHPCKGLKKMSDEEIDSYFKEFSKEEAYNKILSLIPDKRDSIYFGDHINWFNYEKLNRMLSKYNFTTIFKSGYGQSSDVRLRNTYYFDNTCPDISLYVEAYK